MDKFWKDHTAQEWGKSKVQFMHSSIHRYQELYELPFREQMKIQSCQKVIQSAPFQKIKP